MIDYFIIAFFAFFIGYLLGNRNSPPAKRDIVRKKAVISDELKQEYENFLNYDGSEQL